MPMQVFVAEDDEGLCLLFQHTLRKYDLDVVVARDGQQALEMLQTMRPALIFLDVRLPLVTGVRILEYIRSAPHLRDTPVVINSALQEFERLANDHEIFLLKPILPHTIRELVERLLQAPV